MLPSRRSVAESEMDSSGIGSMFDAVEEEVYGRIENKPAPVASRLKGKRRYYDEDDENHFGDSSLHELMRSNLSLKIAAETGKKPGSFQFYQKEDVNGRPVSRVGSEAELIRFELNAQVQNFLDTYHDDMEKFGFPGETERNESGVSNQEDSDGMKTPSPIILRNRLQRLMESPSNNIKRPSEAMVQAAIMRRIPSPAFIPKTPSFSSQSSACNSPAYQATQTPISSPKRKNERIMSSPLSVRRRAMPATPRAIFSSERVGQNSNFGTPTTAGRLRQAVYASPRVSPYRFGFRNYRLSSRHLTIGRTFRPDFLAANLQMKKNWENSPSKDVLNKNLSSARSPVKRSTKYDGFCLEMDTEDPSGIGQSFSNVTTDISEENSPVRSPKKPNKDEDCEGDVDTDGSFDEEIVEKMIH
ncbi:unnamed protein product [Caenorhabditis auriculariae]|uniref:Uncharacterized protein n=1 Tax=Caenorhabditis auriculariae TaxID=2777116 RepID=A0A8S1H573_9PELO|nr:unnamed protein product [Caenorhabditis auriculariae]